MADNRSVKSMLMQGQGFLNGGRCPLPVEVMTLARSLRLQEQKSAILNELEFLHDQAARMREAWDQRRASGCARYAAAVPGGPQVKPIPDWFQKIYAWIVVGLDDVNKRLAPVLAELRALLISRVEGAQTAAVAVIQQQRAAAAALRREQGQTTMPQPQVDVPILYAAKQQRQPPAEAVDALSRESARSLLYSVCNSRQSLPNELIPTAVGCVASLLSLRRELSFPTAQTLEAKVRTVTNQIGRTQYATNAYLLSELESTLTTIIHQLSPHSLASISLPPSQGPAPANNNNNNSFL